ncbi:MAG: DNA-directed RNA polymerase subunit alpha, partial [Lentisphaerae bacterium]|nr:DNA-directed RNA polymerase subunit alpha [Lentisphaerota bacterium]
MTIRIGTFEMPKRLVKEEISPTHARYIAEPLEFGYARTIGNSLRRVLLSSLEGAAISSVRITGEHNEFCPIPGVLEDVTD